MATYYFLRRSVARSCSSANAREYIASIGKERQERRHWQEVSEQILTQADVIAVSWRLRLALLKDAKLDVSKAEMKTRAHFAHRRICRTLPGESPRARQEHVITRAVCTPTEGPDDGTG